VKVSAEPQIVAAFSTTDNEKTKTEIYKGKFWLFGTWFFILKGVKLGENLHILDRK
jgi:hypothetical protein